MDDFAYMRLAMKLADQAAALGEIPVGALVVEDATGKILGQGFNRRETDHDPTAHAEVLAIRQAALALGSWRLSGCTLYVTMEPCPMCCGTIINARVRRVVFGAYDSKAGSADSVINLFALPYNHKPAVTGGLLEHACREQLQTFFSDLREK